MFHSFVTSTVQPNNHECRTLEFIGCQNKQTYGVKRVLLNYALLTKSIGIKTLLGRTSRGDTCGSQGMLKGGVEFAHCTMNQWQFIFVTKSISSSYQPLSVVNWKINCSKQAIPHVGGLVCRTHIQGRRRASCNLPWHVMRLPWKITYMKRIWSGDNVTKQ